MMMMLPVLIFVIVSVGSIESLFTENSFNTTNDDDIDYKGFCLLKLAPDNKLKYASNIVLNNYTIAEIQRLSRMHDVIFQYNRVFYIAIVVLFSVYVILLAKIIVKINYLLELNRVDRYSVRFSGQASRLNEHE